MRVSSNNLMTVKEYASEQHISQQTVYAKICRNADKLKGHVLNINGKKHLDETAQKMLKPAESNARLIEKAVRLNEEIIRKKAETENKLKSIDELTETCNKLKNQLSECDSRIADLEQELSERSSRIEILEQELNEEKIRNAESEKRIDRLLSISDNITGLTERLYVLFGVLEETANSGVGKKIGSLLSGRR